MNTSSRLLIPTTGTLLRLTSDWTFDLFYEYRNASLEKALGMSVSNVHAKVGSSRKVTLDAGTVLMVDRIYIRKGAEGFDSVTFRIHSSPKIKGKPRFWAKLGDVNQIECEFDPATTPGLHCDGVGFAGPAVPRWGDKTDYKVGDRVWVRGMTQNGIGIVMSTKPLNVSVPFTIGAKKKPVMFYVGSGEFLGNYAFTRNRPPSQASFAYGTRIASLNDLKLATPEEIGKQTEEAEAKRERRALTARGMLSYLKALYDDPCSDTELDIIKNRENDWEPYRKLVSYRMTDRYSLALAMTPLNPWDTRIASVEHDVIRAVHQGFLTPEDALNVLPDRITDILGQDYIVPFWDGCGNPLK